MTSQQSKQSILGLSPSQLEEFFKQHGQKSFRAKQVVKWVHQRLVDDFHQMTDLSKELRGFLSETFETPGLSIIKEQRSIDGTRKWLFKTSTGSAI